MAVVLWIAAGLVAYSYCVYPLLMAAVGRCVRGRPAPVPPADAELPSVAVVVAAYNEERHIDARIQNVLALDYPRDRLSLLVGSDGSADRTAKMAETHAGDRVRVLAFAQRRGKASVLNDLVGAAQTDIVVFTDANTMFRRDAIRALVRHFWDPEVGAVSGRLELHAPAGGDNEDGRYWQVETLLKAGESHIGGLLGANGGIYAIRRELFRPLPRDTIVDDFTVVMNVSALGWRAVFEPAAVALEEAPSSIDEEFGRRVRIGIGNYQAFFRHPEYWLRAGAVRLFCYFSHKVVRWFTPHLLLAVLIASAALAARPPYGLLLALQLFGYAALCAGLMLRRYVTLPRIVNVPLFLFAMNVAFGIGFWRYVTGSFSGQWRRTQRA